MKSRFELHGFHEPVLVVEPAFGDEATLMATFLRYDANIFRVSVERSEGGSISRVTFYAEGASES